MVRRFLVLICSLALISSTSLMTLIVLYARDVRAQEYAAVRTFLNPTPAQNDYFGEALVGVGIDKVLVGAREDDTAGPNAGAAYLFSANGELLHTFLNPSPPPVSTDLRLAVVGTSLVLGFSHANTVATQAGAVFLFRGAPPYDLQHAFLAPDVVEDVRFGQSVASLGTKLAVGSAYGNGASAGAAYLFDADPTSATFGSLLQTLVNPHASADDYFSFNLAGEGDRLLVGAERDDSTGVADAGAAYLFDGTTGMLLKEFPNPEPGVDDHFGAQVAFVCGNVLVSAPHDDYGAQDAGSVYLFRGTPPYDLLLPPLRDPTPTAFDQLGGGALAALDCNALVPALGHQAEVGAVHEFDADPLSPTFGNLLHSLLNPSPEAGDIFGLRVATLGTSVLVGARGDSTAGPATGAAYLFTTCGDSSVEPGEVCDDGNTTSGDGCDETCQLEEFNCCSNPAVTCNSDSACELGDTCCVGKCDTASNPPACDALGELCKTDAECGAGGTCCTAPECGNGVREGGECCDRSSQNGVLGSGCTVTCTCKGICTQARTECATSADCPPGEGCCGNGTQEKDEECDDGNLQDGDCCSSSCQGEDTATCVPPCKGVRGPHLLTPASMRARFRDRTHDDLFESWTTSPRGGRAGDFNLAFGQAIDPSQQDSWIAFSENDGSNGRREIGAFTVDPGDWDVCRATVGTDDERCKMSDIDEMRSEPDGVRAAKVRERGTKVTYKFKGALRGQILRPNTDRIRVCVHVGDDAGTAMLACTANSSGSTLRCESTN